MYAVNPQVVGRYRGRHRVSRAKSDRGDAKVLADLVRTDRHNHRQRDECDQDHGVVQLVLSGEHQCEQEDRSELSNRSRRKQIFAEARAQLARIRENREQRPDRRG